MPSIKAPKPFRTKQYDRPLIEAGQRDISLWTRGYFDVELHDWQRYFYHWPAKDKMGIAGIRAGKSFMSAIGALHFCQTHPGALFLNACISSEQAKIVYYTCVKLASMPRFAHWIESIDRSPYPAIRLVNGSEMWFRSVGYEGELLRGFEYDFINLDECAYITSPITISMLKGRLLGVNDITGEPRVGWFWQMSSPKGKNGWTYERWKKGDLKFPGADPFRYLSLRIRTTDNKKLSEEAIRELMEGYTEAQILQELEGAFLDSENLYFPYDKIIDAANDQYDEVRWLNQEIEQWRDRNRSQRSEIAKIFNYEQSVQDLSHYELDPTPGHRYLGSWDLGKKTNEKGRNATVGMVWDITELPWKMVAFRYAPGQFYTQSMDQIEEWQKAYSRAGSSMHTCIDATGVGDVVNETLTIERGIEIDPIVFSGATKPDILMAAKVALERDRARYPFIRRLIDELSLYEKYDKDLAQDCVMAFSMAMYRAHEIAGLQVRQSSGDTPNRSARGIDRENTRREREKLPAWSRYKQRRRLAHATK
jgi:hypothetical protein